MTQITTMVRKVKWAFRCFTNNKASGGDGMPAELFQILKDDVVKTAAHNISANLENSTVGTGLEKKSIFIPIPKKGNVQECSNYHSIVLLSHASKFMLVLILLCLLLLLSQL